LKVKRELPHRGVSAKEIEPVIKVNVMKSQWLLSVLLLNITLVGCSGRLSDFDAGSAGDGNLNGALERIRNDQGLPALAAVLIRSGKIVETGAVGVRAVGSPKPVTIHDRWHLGSNTKSMTATLAAALVEEGTIDWDTTIAEVFPDVAERIRPEYADVRLDELLSQTAGLRERVPLPSYATWESTMPLPEQRRQWAAELLSLAPEVSRGTHRYSNANYVVAGAMLEAVTGEQWEDLMQRKILNPLGMASTGFGAPGTNSEEPDEPRGHQRVQGEFHPLPPDSRADNPPAVGPAGTVHTTLADFARYMAAHLAGARGEGELVSAETFDKLHSPAPGTHYALGWSVAKHSRAGGRVLSHNGSNRMWYATMWIAPERDFAILTVTNAGGSAGAKGADDALRALIDRCNAALEAER
jgi:CubicO group peptidase (beta-lactamase class C family)